MKYAIVESGGKQYKAVEGSAIEVDLLALQPGEQMVIDSVLLVSDDGKVSVGAPNVDGAKVNTTVVEHFKAPKVIVFKYRPRKRYRLRKGHRQKYTRLSIDSIVVE